MAAKPAIGDRAAGRLSAAMLGWLTTVRADGTPQASPVWFVLHDGAIYVRSRRGAAKLRNIAANARVGFHLDGDGQGGNITTIEGTAEVIADPPPAQLSAYLHKYETFIAERVRTTTDAFVDDYSETIRIHPARSRAW